MDFIDFGVIDAIDIIVVAILMWQIYRTVRGTAALTIFAGIFVIYLLWIVVRALGMELLSSLLGQVIGVGALALLIVFQQEVRRYLLMLGSRSSQRGGGVWRKIFSVKHGTLATITVVELVEACRAMSAVKTGALIVMERLSDLEVYATSGDRIDAILSRRLVENIFFKNSPLHDGAMIVRGGRIEAARCILPTSDNPNIPARLGLRHRAAVGVSENSDALVIIVSEETGRISVAENGAIKALVSADDLAEILTS